MAISPEKIRIKTLSMQLDDQLKRLQTLSLEEDQLKTKNKTLQTLYETSSEELEEEVQSLKQTGFDFYDSYDQFCNNVDGNVAAIGSNLEAEMKNSSELTAVIAEQNQFNKEIEESTVEIARLCRLNADNLEMMVLKSDLYRLEQERQLMSNDREQQEKVQTKLSHIRAEIERHEVRKLQKRSRQQAGTATAVTPPAKRRFIMPPGAPNNSPNDSPTKIVVKTESGQQLTDSKKIVLNVVNRNGISLDKDPEIHLTDQNNAAGNKFKFVFKQAT